MVELSETGIALICSLFLLVAVMITVAIFVARTSCKGGSSSKNSYAPSVNAIQPAIRKAAASAIKKAGSLIKMEDPDMNGLYHVGEDISHDATNGMRQHVEVELPPELQMLLEASANGFESKPLGGNGTVYGSGSGGSGERNVMDAITCTYPSICEQVCNNQPLSSELRQDTQQFEALCPCELVHNCMNSGSGTPLSPVM
jgi:hypothetical protein